MKIKENSIQGQSKANPRPIPWITIAKGIAILCVVAGHTFDPASYKNKIIFSFHMPLFFILAGYTFSVKNTFFEFAIKKAVRLLLPYFLSVIWDFIGWFACGRIIIHDATSLKDMAFSICRFAATGNAYWFLPCLFLAELFFYWTVRILKENDFFACLISTLLLISGYFIGIHKKLSWSVDIALYVQLFLFIGYYLRKKDFFNKPLNWYLELLFLLIWFIGINSFFISIYNRDYATFFMPFIAGVSGSILVMQVAKYMEKSKMLTLIMSYFGSISLVIFLFHLIDLTYLHLNALNCLNFIYSKKVYLCIFRTGISVLIAEIFRLIPFLRNIYGLKKCRV